jgi:hypothetical protein
MKIKQLYKILTILTLGLLVYSCQKYDDPAIIDSSTYPISGEWWVTLRDTSGAVLANYAKLLTYNTSSDKGDSVWIDDGGNIYGFKVKAACNVKAKSFAVDSIVNQVPDYPIKVDIKNGIVVLKGGKTKGGNVSDSIFMKIGFGDDLIPGTVYIISGVRRTGFKADDY